ncbi:MAG: site-specific integrase [Oscillospiraceae bacterium]|nr:site-specific integrase [Oscillospiraceae bacterium]
MGKGASGAGSIRKKTVTRKGKTYTYWEGRVTTGRHPGTGKQIQKSFSGKTQKEVLDKMRAAAMAVSDGTYQEPSKLTLGQWLDIWEKEYLLGKKDSTRSSYGTIIRVHLTPAMGALKLQSLAPHHIQSFINGLSDSLEPSTVHNIHMVLHYALAKAVKLDYIPKNPAAECELPRLKRKEIHPVDVAAFLEAAKGDKCELLFKVDVFTGMRRGEIAGLTWKCVDFRKGTISVSQQLQKRKGGYYFTTPKNGKSRVITPAPRVMEYLKEQKRKQTEDRLLAGPLWQDLGFVFTNEVGNHLDFNMIDTRFKKIAIAIGAPEARFHDLRHTYAVNSIRAGDDIKTVQENLGHASAAFTLDVYAHVTEEMRKDSASRMEAFMEEILGL